MLDDFAAVNNAAAQSPARHSPHADPLGYSGAEVLDEHIRASHEPHQGVQASRRLEVERDGAFVAVVVQE